MASDDNRLRRDLRLFQRAVEAVLIREWDPLGVGDSEFAQDEYDSYAPVICRLVWEGANEATLVAHLAQLQVQAMGLSAADESRDRRVARLLLALPADYCD